ncbi:conserved hypothetical protein [Pseudolactococcus piscium]|nr:conserved hypothetical protein [Lactococcus piscium]
MIQARTGSPPQVRVKDVSFADGDSKYRITPAGAGKSSNNSSNEVASRDHPRRCG